MAGNIKPPSDDGHVLMQRKSITHNFSSHKCIFDLWSIFCRLGHAVKSLRYRDTQFVMPRRVNIRIYGRSCILCQNEQAHQKTFRHLKKLLSVSTFRFPLVKPDTGTNLLCYRWSRGDVGEVVVRDKRCVLEVL